MPTKHEFCQVRHAQKLGCSSRLVKPDCVEVMARELVDLLLFDTEARRLRPDRPRRTVAVGVVNRPTSLAGEHPNQRQRTARNSFAPLDYCNRMIQIDELLSRLRTLSMASTGSPVSSTGLVWDVGERTAVSLVGCTNYHHGSST